MFYPDASELSAELIRRPHSCGPGCLCWELRAVPATQEALQKLGRPQYQTIDEARLGQNCARFVRKQGPN